jgi:glycosyltransferase involved in cell wall biosynthesis
MHILICNERFLFRFGVDRVLLILAQGLKERGHEVTFIGNRFDYDVASTCATNVIALPPATDYFYANEQTLDYLSEHWQEYFPTAHQPDLALIGGWPFFAAIPLLKAQCRKVVFLDCGAVPLDGFEGGALVIQNKVRAMRNSYLKETSQIIAISDFIARSQSVIDSDKQVPCTSVLLGADHIEHSLWQASQLKLNGADNHGLDLLRLLRAEGKKNILAMGRWEPRCYKNSEAAFDILRKILRQQSNATLLILANSVEVDIPKDLAGRLFPIGFPDDATLQQIMRESDLGISVSLWEGFNLPLAEMQWLNRPALVFDVAAHPEVVIHPWYLCRDNDEMADKAVAILREQGLEATTRQRALDKFHGDFAWKKVFAAYYEIIHEIATTPDEKAALSFSSSPQAPSFVAESPLNHPACTVFIDVTNATKDPANSGVIRVTRRISQELQKLVNVVFVVWSDVQQCYVLPTFNEFTVLSQFNGPKLLREDLLSPAHAPITLAEFHQKLPPTESWLLFTETVSEIRASQARAFARTYSLKTAAIFYDAIPVLRPELCKDEAVRNNHAVYMQGLANCDVVIPISNYSAECLKAFWRENGLRGGRVEANLLPGEFGGATRATLSLQPFGNEVHILCVSTLEPRKNHRNLIEACLLLGRAHPDFNWKLTLVGNRYVGGEDIAQYVESVAATNPRVTWTGIVDDQTLHALYEQATFTVYPSLIEGFGMPILESIWHGKPCLCHQEGVMAELARDGGCYVTDVTDIYALASSIYALATNQTFQQNLVQEALTRQIKTWQDYAQEFVTDLQLTAGQPFPQMPTQKTASSFTDTRMSTTETQYAPLTSLGDWQDVLYPNCLRDNWQMNDAERLALTALLHRLKPRCSIEIGTYMGGSLSLLAQYSERVYSVDIDPEIPKKFRQFTNTQFLTGPSVELMPALLNQLDATRIPVDFILIDGDHSAEGIMRDVSWIVNYVPRGPLFVLMHDSFNPNCRRGMLNANWHESPYLKYLDLDFIPGRVIQHGGGGHGEMWGGFALACFDQHERQGAPPPILQSADLMFSKLNQCKQDWYT